MSIEHLREAIRSNIESSYGETNPTPFQMANVPAAFLWNIFAAESEEVQRKVAEKFGYPDIAQLRVDVELYIEEMRGELTPEQWEAYFGELKDSDTSRDGRI